MELDQKAFKRLAWLYLLSYVLALAASVYESISPAWRSFADEFDHVVSRHTQRPEDGIVYTTALICLFGIIWHVVSVIGLLRFKRWARWGFWVSILLTLPLMSATAVTGPYYVGFWGGLTSLANGVLFGMVLLFSYSKQHGFVWFERRNRQLQEVN